MLRKREIKYIFIAIKICLLLLVGIFCISDLFILPVKATSIMEPSTSELLDNVADTPNNNFNISLNNGTGELAGTLRILITLTLIALAPTLIICLTSFIRIIIVLHFTRSALNTQSAPPNQVLIGLALFLTFFIMTPIITQINDTVVKPFDAGEITQEEALEKGMEPLREFMYGQTQTKDVKMF